MELICSHRKFRTMPFKPVESRTPISLEFLDKLRIGTLNYKNGETVMKTDVWNKESYLPTTIRFFLAEFRTLPNLKKQKQDKTRKAKRRLSLWKTIRDVRY